MDIDKIRNLFIITSVIFTSNTPLSYVNTRSLYTPLERLEQTKKTIQTIRNKVKNVYICLSEGSKLPNDMENEIISLVDKYINFGDVEDVRQAVNDPLKGKGEISLILNALNQLNNLHEFDNIFKISGRYYLNDKFNIDNFMNNKNIFCLCGDRYATTLYKIYRPNINTYIQALKYALPYVSYGVEQALHAVYPPNHEHNLMVNVIGVSGYIAVFNNYYIEN